MIDFLTLIKDSNFNISEIYKQAPNESLLVLVVLLALIAVAYFFINNSVKKSILLKELSKIENITSFKTLVEKLNLIINELPKRGELTADALEKSKEKIVHKALFFLSDFSIKEKIENYQLISKKFKQLSQSCDKYNKEKLSLYFKSKSAELLNVELNKELENYFDEVRFNLDELENINIIIEYANKQNSPYILLDKLFKNLNKFSFSHNLELYKFIEKLDKTKSKQLFDYCSDKMEKLFTSGEDVVSINILEYLYVNDNKEKVYEYIKNLKLDSYLQQLYYQLFDKKEDLDLDLAFIANATKIENDYKNYIDNSLTTNWRDKEHIQYVSKAPGVLDVLGHTEFRSLIERVDRIKTDIENSKKIEEALMIAKRAESIAIEAKSFNQINSKTKEKPLVQPKVD